MFIVMSFLSNLTEFSALMFVVIDHGKVFYKKSGVSVIVELTLCKIINKDNNNN